MVVQNFRGEPKWLETIVVERTGPASYRVCTGEEIDKRHVDQMLERKDARESKRDKEDHNMGSILYDSLDSQQVSSKITHTNDGPPCCTP